MSPSAGFREFCLKCKYHDAQLSSGECWHMCSYQIGGKVVWKDPDIKMNKELGDKTAEIINKALMNNPLLAYCRCPYQLEYTMSAQE